MENRTAAISAEDQAPVRKRARDFEPHDDPPVTVNDPPAGPPRPFDCDDLTDQRPSHGHSKAHD